MLISYSEPTQLTSHWENLQQPVHGANQQADRLRLLAALDEGWQIQEVAKYLAHGSNDEDRGYLLTLYHPQRRLTRECNVVSNSAIDALLAFEGLPGFIA
jgi:hypothetical protein